MKHITEILVIVTLSVIWGFHVIQHNCEKYGKFQRELVGISISCSPRSIKNGD